MVELRGLGAVQEELRRRGGTILAVAVDPPREALRVVEKNRLDFPVLCDVQRRVIRDYGLVHAGGAPDGGDIAVPAHMLIGRDGRIVWRRVSGRVQDRPVPEEVLKQIRALD